MHLIVSVTVNELTGKISLSIVKLILRWDASFKGERIYLLCEAAHDDIYSVVRTENDLISSCNGQAQERRDIVWVADGECALCAPR